MRNYLIIAGLFGLIMAAVLIGPPWLGERNATGILAGLAGILALIIVAGEKSMSRVPVSPPMSDYEYDRSCQERADRVETVQIWIIRAMILILVAALCLALAR